LNSKALISDHYERSNSAKSYQLFGASGELCEQSQ